MLENGVNTHHALWTHYLSPMAWMMWMQEGLMKPRTEETLVKEQKKLTQEMFIKIFVHNLSSMHVFPNSSLKCKYGFSIRSFFSHKCVLVVFNRLQNRIWIIIECNIKSMLIMLDWVANIWEKILEKKVMWKYEVSGRRISHWRFKATLVYRACSVLVQDKENPYKK